MPKRATRQLGQTSIEYLGVLLAVAGVLGVILLASPDIGRTISCKIEAQISALTGEAGSLGCAGVRGEPTEACTVTDSSGKLKASLTAFSIRGGGDVKLLRETLSDGTVRITAAGGGNLGLNGKLGASGGVDVGDFTATQGAEADGTVSVKGEVSSVWEFKSKAEADEFVEIVRNRARDGAIKGIAPGVGHVVTGLGLFGTGEDRPVPDSRYTIIQGGGGASGSAEAGAGTAYVGGGLEASSIAGVKIDNKTGAKTIFYTLSGSGEASAGALLGIGGQGDIEGQLAVTVDAEGRPTEAQIVGQAGYTGENDFAGGRLKGVSPKKLLEGFGAKGSAQSGQRGEVRGTLDLKDPANAAAFQDFVSNPFTGADDIARRFAEGATWDARIYSVDRDKYGGDLSFGAGLAFGIEAGYEGVDSTLQDAYYWSPNSGGIQPWATCKQ